MCTQKKRLAVYEALGIYKKPDMYDLKNQLVAKFHENNKFVMKKNIAMVNFKLSDSLKNMLEIPGLFDATMTNMNDLYAEEKVLSNFIQGETWNNAINNFEKKDGIPIPLDIYFDEVEPGNAQGAHAVKNLIGCVYAHIPCLPENFVSKLNSIIVAAVFLASDKKKYGNEKVFANLKKELIKLRDEGIEIIVNKRRYKLYFLTTLIIGDNLGSNSILGFVESFALTLCCRFCYASPDLIKSMTTECPILLRTVEKYKEDIKVCNLSESGIKEPCIWNELPDYHVIENSSLDLMHDLPEGMSSNVMADILLYLVCKENAFKIDWLNNRLKEMNFDFESPNVPLSIDIDYVKRKRKLKMSASETLFFTRYFGVIVGDRVDKDSDVWKLYIDHREIVSILTKPQLTKYDLLRFEKVIKSHHELYKDLFGELKPKFHFSLHYGRAILKNGPAIKVSSFRFESKHQEILKIILATHSKVHMLYSLGVRLQLSQMRLDNENSFIYKEKNITYGDITAFNIENLPYSTARKFFKKIVINDIAYKVGTVIVVEYCNCSRIWKNNSNF